jgi:YVTN family beta-propeller protein
MVRVRRHARLVVVSSALAALALAHGAGAATPMTPAGWRLTPAGAQASVTVGPGMSGPWGEALSPDGRSVLVTSSGTSARFESVEQWSLDSLSRTGAAYYDGRQGQSVFYGIAYSPDGRRAWASGGGQNVVHVLDVGNSAAGLAETATVPAGDFPAGIAYGDTPLGPRLYVANNLGGLPFTVGSYEDPPGHTVTVIDPATNRVTATIDLGLALDPLGVAFNHDATRAYVTQWAGRSVAVIDTRTQRMVGTVELSPLSDPLQADHPSGIAANPVRDEVYTANASSDTVSVIDTRHDRLAATIDVGLVPGGPKGSMPEGLSASPDGRMLYVALAGEDAVAVVDLRLRRTIGFVPTAWYPSGVAVTPDGRSLVVINTNGLGAGPNPCGGILNPLPPSSCTGDQYVGSMIRGSVEKIPVPDARSLASYTRQVRLNNRVFERAQPRPPWLGAIKHVIYVIKENRSYDQVFGDLGKGNGDPAIDLFKDDSAPNHRALARRFSLLDDNYVDAEVSADGHPWSVQAIATDYVDKTWPFDYADAYYRSYNSEFVPLAQQFPSEPLASDPSVPRSAAAATAGYLWDDAYDHGVSFRDYGEGTPWDDPSNCSSGAEYSDLTRLSARFGQHVDPRFPGWNLDCSDHAVREPEWEREFRDYVRNGNLPGLEIVYFPNDHNAGTTPGLPTPQSYMADNDLALGRLVEAVSHSPYWLSTAIFVVEDDAQDGPDHVDAHRAPSLVISPYTQWGRVDSTHYDTASTLGTLEDLLGLPPMSAYDARATRMWRSFRPIPNLRPYNAIEPTVVPFGDTGAPVNEVGAPLAAASAQMDFTRPDLIPEDLLNEAVWKSVKGARSQMPAPVHSLLLPPHASRDAGGRPAAPIVESEDSVAWSARAARGERRLRAALRDIGARRP